MAIPARERGRTGRAFREGRRRAECLGPGAQAELGGRGRLSRCKEEKIENSVGPGVRACVWGWEVRAVPRARARVSVRVCLLRARVCVCVYECTRVRLCV